MEFSRLEYWSGSLSLLQRIFPTQRSNPGLPYCRQILYQLSHKGSPRVNLAAQQKKKRERGFLQTLMYQTMNDRVPPTWAHWPGHSVSPTPATGKPPQSRKQTTSSEASALGTGCSPHVGGPARACGPTSSSQPFTHPFTGELLTYCDCDDVCVPIRKEPSEHVQTDTGLISAQVLGVPPPGPGKAACSITKMEGSGGPIAK